MRLAMIATVTSFRCCQLTLPTQQEVFPSVASMDLCVEAYGWDFGSEDFRFYLQQLASNSEPLHAQQAPASEPNTTTRARDRSDCNPVDLGAVDQVSCWAVGHVYACVSPAFARVCFVVLYFWERLHDGCIDCS
jgi:hypothetical protein